MLKLKPVFLGGGLVMGSFLICTWQDKTKQVREQEAVNLVPKHK